MPFAQGVTADAGSATSASLTLNKAVAAGSGLIVAARYGSTSNNLTGVSDSINGAWPPGALIVNQIESSIGYTLYVLFLPNTLAGNLTLTITFSSVGSIRWMIFEESFCARFNAIDVVSSTDQSGSRTSFTQNITTIIPHASLLAFLSSGNDGSNLAVINGVGWTKRLSTIASASRNNVLDLSDMFASTPGAYGESWGLGGGGGATLITQIQGGISPVGTSAVSSVSVTLGAAVSAGDCLVGHVYFASTDGSQLSSVTDNKGNTYTILDKLADTSNVSALATYFLPNIVNGPSTITANFGVPTSSVAIGAREYAGVATSSPIDGHAIVNQVGAPTTTNGVTVGPITTSVNGDLIYAVSADTNGALTGAGTGYVAGTGFTLHNEDIASATQADEDLIQGSFGAISGTFTIGTTTTVLSAIVALKPAVSGSGDFAATAIIAIKPLITYQGILLGLWAVLGTSLTIDAQAPTERLATIAFDSQGPDESLVVAICDSSLPTEIALTVKADNSDLVTEFLSTVKADANASTEVLATSRQDSVADSEFVAAITIDSAAPDEHILAVIADTKLPDEALLSLRYDAQSPDEIIVSTRIDAKLPDEILAKVTIDAQALDEVITSVRADAQAPDEVGLRVVQDARALNEVLLTVPIDSRMPTEFLGVLVVIVDGAAPVEFLVAQRSDAQAPIELLRRTLFDSAASTEVITRITINSISPTEALVRLVTDGSAATELLGKLAVDSTSPTEWLLVLRADSLASTEWMTTTVFIVDGFAPVEWLMRASSDAIGPTEWRLTATFATETQLQRALEASILSVGDIDTSAVFSIGITSMGKT